MGRKHCGEKEKLLVTSNISFSHSVFKRHVLQTRKNQGLLGKGLRKKVSQFTEKSWQTGKILSQNKRKISYEKKQNPFSSN